MTTTNHAKLTSLGLATMLFAVLSGTAEAAKPDKPSNATYTNCSGVISGLISGAIDCEISDQTQDFLKQDPMTVNLSGGFFDTSDWLFGGKIGNTDGYEGTAEGKSGTYDFSLLFNNTNWDNVMLIFKGGNDTSLVGYLLGSGVTSGTWASPFRTPDFSVGKKIKDVSHISVYYTEGRTKDNGSIPPAGITVPEPGELALLAIGFFGAASMMRIKRLKALRTPKSA